MIQPITNPIRFYKVSEVPDFNTYFPTIHNQAIGVEYYEAFKPLPYMREFDINENFRFQIQGGYDNVSIYKNNVYLADTTVNTTYGINKVFLYILSEGIWQFKFNTDEWVSDYIYVKSKNKRLIKVQAWNYPENNFNTIFNLGTSTIYKVNSYYSGFITPKIGTTYIEQYKGDPNTIINVEIEPSFEWTVNIEVHQTYLKHILYLFSLNNIKINGKDVTLKGEIKDSPIGETDIVMVVFDVRLDNTYNYD
jgi:hypothetical protein